MHQYYTICDMTFPLKYIGKNNKLFITTLNDNLIRALKLHAIL